MIEFRSDSKLVFAKYGDVQNVRKGPQISSEVIVLGFSAFYRFSGEIRSEQTNNPQYRIGIYCGQINFCSSNQF